MSAYKNLEIYQSAFNLAIKVYRMNIMLPVNALLNQGNRLRWASLLIKDLIAEAYTGIKSEKEVVRNLTLAETSTEEVIKLLQEDAIQSAVIMIKNALAKAAMIKIDGLDSEDEKIRQAVASEILDRQLGKSIQRSELSGPNGGPIETTYVNLSDADLDAAIARELNSRKDTSQEE